MIASPAATPHVSRANHDSPASRRARRHLGVALLTVGLLVAVSGCGSDDGAPELSDPSATGRELVAEFLDAFADPDAVDEVFTDAYQVQRADGTRGTKADAMAGTVQIDDYEIIEPVVATQDGDALTVTWALAIDETIDGETFRLEPKPRLTVFVWDEDRWRVAGHANFNSPG